MSDEDRILLQSVARAILTDSRGTLADRSTSPRVRRHRSYASSRLATHRAELPSQPMLPRARSAVLQRPRRLHPGRPRICHHDDAQDTSRRRRGSTCWPTRSSAPSSRRAAEPTPGARTRTSSASRPGTTIPVTRFERRGFYLRDEESGHFWSPTPLPCRGASALRQPPRLRLQRLRALRGRDQLRAVGVRRDRCAGQVLGAQAAQRFGPTAPAVRDRLRGMGAGRPAAEVGDARGHRDGSEERRRCSRAIPTTPISPAGSPSSTSMRRSTYRDAATGPNFSAATAALREPAAWPHAAVRARSGAGTRSLCAPSSAVRAGRRSRARDRLHCSASAQTSTMRVSWCSASAARRHGARCARKACGSTGNARSGPCMWRRPTRRSTSWPTAGCSTRPRLPPLGAQRLLPVGRRVRLPRPVAGCDGAGPRRAASAARASCCAPGHQFLEGDVQHWWHPPSGRGVRHAFLRRLSLAAAAPCAATSRRTGDTGVLDERVAVPRGPAGQCPTRTRTTTCPSALGRIGARSTSTACAPF